MEVSAIEGEDVEDSVALADNDYRGSGKADCKFSIAPDHHGCRNHIAGREGFEVVGPSTDLVKKSELCLALTLAASR